MTITKEQRDHIVAQLANLSVPVAVAANQVLPIIQLLNTLSDEQPPKRDSK